jgi:hypothetical protein
MSGYDESAKSAAVHWLEGTPLMNSGATFGLPWSRGKYHPSRTAFICSGESGTRIPLQYWVKGYWPDGSIRWSAHAIPASTKSEIGYTVEALIREDVGDGKNERGDDEKRTEIRVTRNDDQGVIEVQTGKIPVRFSTRGNSIVRSIETVKGTGTG